MQGNKIMSTYRIVSTISRRVITHNGKGRLPITSSCRRTFASNTPLTPPPPPPLPPARKSQGTSTFKLALIGMTLGGAFGTLYSLYENWKDKTSHMEHERIPPKLIEAFPPNVKITKRFVNPEDKSDLEVVLFQFQTCPFCCKVRAFLDFKGISYSVVEVDAVLRQDIKWSEQKKVPMVLVRSKDGRYIQMFDSSAIISLLASYLGDRKTDIKELANFYPAMSFFDDYGKKKVDIMNKYFLMYQDRTPIGLTQDMQENERKWRTWADNHLVHLISPNCYQTLGEAFETFEWFAEAGEWDVYFPRWERNLMVYVGATAMWGISKILKKRHGLSDDVRYHIYSALDKWTNELRKQKTKFMGGKTPNLADLSVFGVLSSMEGCQAFKDCLENTNIGEWFYAVKEQVQKNRGNLVRLRMGDQSNFPPVNASVA